MVYTHTKLGEGVVVSRTKVHHKPVTSEEVALQVTSVEGDDELKHPYYYDYPRRSKVLCSLAGVRCLCC